MSEALPKSELSVRDAQDIEELRSHQLVKRREFEQQLNKNRLNLGQWLRYARWESNECHDWSRARSIYERALDVDISYIPFWVQYIRFELAHKAINHARNLLDRATTVLPHVDKLWYMYVHTEEMLKNYTKVIVVFERWLQWHPGAGAWDAYLSYCSRYRDLNKARDVFMRYVNEHTGSITWLKWVSFEQDQPNNTGNIRFVYESGADRLLEAGDQSVAALIESWAEWEASVMEFDRARAIYNQVLKQDIEAIRPKIIKSLGQFESTYGADPSTMSDSTLSRQMAGLQQTVAADPRDFDSWWNILNLSASEATFEKALSQTPVGDTKSTNWKRYIFIWIRYALWVEFTQESADRAHDIWKRAVIAVSPNNFTSARLWIEYSRFAIRQGGLSEGRKVLGKSIGKTSRFPPKPKLLRFYIELERSVGEWSRVRKVYEKWLELATANGTWVEVIQEYVDFEQSISEDARSRALVSLAAATGDPKALNFAIDWFNSEMLYDESRQVYESAVAASNSGTLWIAFALFESQIPTDIQLDAFNASDAEELELEVTDDHRKATRTIFARALEVAETKDKIKILRAWKQYENVHGDDAHKQWLLDRQPVQADDGSCIFPDVDAPVVKPNLSKFLARAKAWKEKESQ